MKARKRTKPQPKQLNLEFVAFVGCPGLKVDAKDRNSVLMAIENRAIKMRRTMLQYNDLAKTLDSLEGELTNLSKLAIAKGYTTKLGFTKRMEELLYPKQCDECLPGFDAHSNVRNWG